MIWLHILSQIVTGLIQTFHPVFVLIHFTLKKTKDCALAAPFLLILVHLGQVTAAPNTSHLNCARQAAAA